MKKLINILAVTVLVLPMSIDTASAQQDAIYSQYMFNPMAINPAYAGSRNSFSSVFLYRQQWAGIDGAPSTGSFAVHGPLKGKNMALGFNFVHDEIGPLSVNAAYGTYGYHLQTGGGKLSLALRAGIFSGTYDYSMLNYENSTDGYAQLGTIQDAQPSFDFGMYYYTNQFYAGLSVTHLEGASLNFGNDSLSNLIDLKQHLMFASGYAFEINSNLVFKPSVLVKYALNAPVNVDINASMLFKKVFWFGLSYRHNSAVAIITEYNVTDWMRLGYSYDMVTNRLNRFTRGSHELFIGFDFSIKKDNEVSPRYM